MSMGNAIRQREEMITEYKRLLLVETNQTRIEDIQDKIRLCEEQIALLRVNKPLFGSPKPLPQATRIIEADPEIKGGQKVTFVNSPSTPAVNLVASQKKFGNKLRETLKEKTESSAENSLRAKILAAKANKLKTNA